MWLNRYPLTSTHQNLLASARNWPPFSKIQLIPKMFREIYVWSTSWVVVLSKKSKPTINCHAHEHSVTYWMKNIRINR